MSMKADLSAVLKSICPRAFADAAPTGTAKPYVVWQAIGGRSLRNLDNTPADKRHTAMQISVWAINRLEANNLVRQIEDALCASPALIASPMGEPLSDYEFDTKLHGSIQTFSIYSNR